MTRDRYKEYIDIFYIMFMGTVLGSALFAGAVVAPTIFKSELLFDIEVLTHLQEGIIMSNIFIKFNYLLKIFILFTVAYEIYLYKNMDRSLFRVSTLFIFISTAILFTDYYTPQILELIESGESSSELFKNLHFASELDFKIMTLALLILLGLKLSTKKNIAQ